MKTTLQPEAADLEAIRRETEARRAHRRLQRIMAAAHGELERHRFDQRPRRQLGGSMGLPLSMADPFRTRETASQMMRSPAGGLLSGTPGLPGVAGGMAGVAPGTEVAGLAMGSNPLSGARLGSGMTETRPYGIAAPRIVREGPGAPRPPSVPASVTNPSSGLTDTIDTLRGIGLARSLISGGS